MSDSHSIDSAHGSNVITRAKSAGEHFQLSDKGLAQIVSSGPAAASDKSHSASVDAKGLIESAVAEPVKAAAISAETAADLDSVAVDSHTDSESDENDSLHSISTSSEDAKLYGLKKRPKDGDSELLAAAYDEGLLSPVDSHTAFDFGESDPISPVKVAMHLDFLPDTITAKVEKTSVAPDTLIDLGLAAPLTATAPPLPEFVAPSTVFI